jgi:hypothetical protein
MPRLRSTLRCLLPALALLCCLPASAAAAPQMTWSAQSPFDVGNGPTAVACTSEALCIAVHTAGNALTSPDPGAAEQNCTS